MSSLGRGSCSSSYTVIHYFEMPAFIVTLAGIYLARGAAFLMSTQSIPINAPLYTDIGLFTIHLPGGGGLPVIAMVMLAVFAAGAVLLHFTRFGTNVYALGGSRQSTALMGVRVGPTIRRRRVPSSVLAGLSGIVFSFYTAAGYALSAVGVSSYHCRRRHRWYAVDRWRGIHVRYLDGALFMRA